MKLNQSIAAVLSIAASSSLWASTPGKHITEKVPHIHGQEEAKNVVEHTILKRIGPPGKGSMRHLSNNR